MQPAFLKGHTISLRVPVSDDVYIRGWANWYNDQQITRHNYHGIFPVSQDQEWEIIKNEMQNPTSLLLSVYENEEDRLIGNVCLQEIDLINRNARLAITIGEHGPPTAYVEAFGLMTNHAFMRLNLNKILDATHEKLISLVKSVSIFGFEIEGRGKEHFLKDGKVYDLIYFGGTQKAYLEKLKLRNDRVLFANKDELLEAVRNEMRK